MAPEIVVVFDPIAQSILGFTVFAHALGMLMNIILMTAIIKNNHSLSQNNILNLNAIFADMLLAAVTMSVSTLNLGKTSNHVTGFVCQFSGIAVMGSEVVVVFTMVFIAFYQYRCVVLRKPILENKSLYLIIALIWMFGIGVSSIPSALPTTMVDMHSTREFGGICLPPASTRKPVSIGLEIVTLLVMFLTPNILIFMYAQIWSKIKRARDDVAKTTYRKKEVSAVVSVNEHESSEGDPIPNSPTRMFLNAGRRLSFAVLTPAETPVSSPQISRFYHLPSPDTILPPGRSKGFDKLDVRVEKIILVRAIIVASIFLLFFFPLACVWAYELTSGKTSPYWVEGIAYCLVSTCPFVNALVLMRLDRPYRQAVLKLFGQSPQSDTSTPKTKNGHVQSAFVSQKRLNLSDSDKNEEETRPRSCGRSLPNPTLELGNISEEKDSNGEKNEST